MCSTDATRTYFGGLSGNKASSCSGQLSFVREHWGYMRKMLWDWSVNDFGVAIRTHSNADASHSNSPGKLYPCIGATGVSYVVVAALGTALIDLYSGLGSGPHAAFKCQKP